MDESVSPSVSDTSMSWIVMPGQCNALGSVFGGQVMAVFLDIYGNESQEIIPRERLASRPAKKPAARAAKKTGR